MYRVVKRIMSIELLSLLLLIILPAPLFGEVPGKINYQGYLTNSAGKPVNGSVSMTFSLYTQLEGGSPCWTETKSVSVAEGFYNVVLGSTNPLILTGCFASNDLLYLGVKVGSDSEMTPRQVVTSTGYAIRAGTADEADIASSVSSYAAMTDVLNHDGSSSGLDADLLDGNQGSFYRNATNINSGTLNDNYYSAIGDLANEGYLAGASGDIAMNTGTVQSNLNADMLDGYSGADFFNAGNLTGTVNNARFSAYSDLNGEGYLNNSSDTDLLTRSQADTRYANTDGDTISGDLTIDDLTVNGNDITNQAGELRIKSDFDVTVSIDDNDTTSVEWFRVTQNNMAQDLFRVWGYSDNTVEAHGPFRSSNFDIAEMIEPNPDQQLKPGDVVVVDPYNDWKVKRSTKPYDPTVAGVISTKPAFLMGKPFITRKQVAQAKKVKIKDLTDEKFKKAVMKMEAEATAVPLALAGTVPCKVTDEGGPIQRGDLLTTSSTPGHAMKATVDDFNKVGSIIGKALGKLESGKGVIRILVTLQ